MFLSEHMLWNHYEIFFIFISFTVDFLYHVIPKKFHHLLQIIITFQEGKKLMNASARYCPPTPTQINAYNVQPRRNLTDHSVP